MQYRVFIGSPGGLEAERKSFRDALAAFNRDLAERDGVIFSAVGWEETLGGQRRPQEQINDELRQCDYAVFVLHDRWGSPTGNGSEVGTEEEWRLACKLHENKQIRKIFLTFKAVSKNKLTDPGPQLQHVLDFRQQIIVEKKHLFRDFKRSNEFHDIVRAHLADWYFDHRRNGSERSLSTSNPTTTSSEERQSEPSFEYWIDEALRLTDSKAGALDSGAALFCAKKASQSAGNDLDVARALSITGIAQFYSDDIVSALQTFQDIIDRLSNDECEENPALREQTARSIFNKGFTLGALGRSEEEISTYDDLIQRFGGDPTSAMREQVAKSLFNKAVTLGTLNDPEGEIATYNDLIQQFGEDQVAALREQVAKSLFNKGFRLGALDRPEEEIAAYDELIQRFGEDQAPDLREQVAQSIINKGITLGALNRSEEAIAAYDDLIRRFGEDKTQVMREPLAKALFNKGFRLGALSRSEEAIAAYDELIQRFGEEQTPAVREHTARALFNKGFRFGALERSEEAVATYDELIQRFGEEQAPVLREQAARALFNKGIRLEVLDRSQEAIAAYDDLIHRFGEEQVPAMRGLVTSAQKARQRLIRPRRATKHAMPKMPSARAPRRPQEDK
jgi:tetratricopeptide (TPR) repeat protein